MTKENTYILKGIAILMLLFLHLFCGQINELRPELPQNLYQPLFYLGNHPIEYIITRFCRAVQFFFILSGYGIGYLHSQGKLNVKGRLKSLFFIFTAYWITLLIFIPLGNLMGYSQYPGDFWTFIANASSYSNSYNLAMWFLFPYSLITLSSPVLIKLIEYRKSYLLAVIVTGLLYVVVSYIFKFHIQEIGWNSLTSHLLQYLHYFFPFTCGIVLEKTHFLEYPIWQKLKDNRLLPIVLLIILICIKSLFNSRIADTPYVIAFIILFIHIPINSYLKKVLSFLGKYSMGIWMVHMFLSHYIFTEFFYGLRYPIIIFSALVFCSLAISIVITKINNYIRQLII